MEKLDIQVFRNLKQEMAESMAKIVETLEKGDELAEEEEQQFYARYNEIIGILSEHDLSDIDFEEWRGMPLFSDEEHQLDFSKSKANIDFSIIEYSDQKGAIPNFKGCKIKNFDFKKYYYSPETFDAEYIKENENMFLSENISKEVADRFYNGETTLTDIQNNPELMKKVEEKNMNYYLAGIYKVIGREKLYKLDAQFIDGMAESQYSMLRVLRDNPELTTAEKIMPALYQFAREKIIGYSRINMGGLSLRQDTLGENFRKQNPDLFLDENAPESVKEDYYSDMLSLEEFSQNLKLFEGKKVLQAFENRDRIDKNIINLYGEKVYQLFSDYKPIMDTLLLDYDAMNNVNVPEGPITDEKRKEIIGQALEMHIAINGLKTIQNWDEFKMILDFVPLEDFNFSPNTTRLIKKYGLETIEKSGLDVQCFLQVKELTNLDEMTNLKGIESSDIQRLISDDNREIINEYGIEKLLEFGIKDLAELSEIVNDLKQVRELLKKMPIDLINMGENGHYKKEFIYKYGIDNIIALDEETNGMFSHPIWSDDIYLTLFAMAEHDIIKQENDKQITYKQFRDKMYEILLHARDEKGILTFGDFPDYGFIKGEFREEHPEIFIDDDVPETVKKAFYTRRMTAEMVRQNPKLVKLLEGKELSRAFGKRINVEENLAQQDEGENTLRRFSNTVNMAQFLSEKLGQESFLKLCVDYGKCLDQVDILMKNEVTLEMAKKTIDEAIYKAIKETRKYLNRASSKKYMELFKRFDDETLMKIGVKYAETIEKMVENHKEDTLQNWYKATGGKFVPHHVVMLNYPEGEIDSFLANGKRWSQLMKIENYNLNDDGKTAILKAAYSMGVFRSDDDGFNKTMKLFTDVPQELTQEEYDKATGTLESSEEIKNLFKQAYTLNDDGKYVFGMDKQKNKDSVKTIRKILENAQIPRILTPEKAHQMFDSFLLEYNPDFAKFFNDNLKEILSNQEYTKDIATIQRQFKDIVKTNAGRRLTLDVAQNYIKSIAYTDIEVGNEKVAEQAKIAGYSQKDFETIQHLYNEGETREFSSIPRIYGSAKGYTYEMLRCDDPLGLTIGTLTDCCQEIHGAGQTSMEHSVVSPDGRVFCVKDAEGRLVAQSWFWRNQYTGCFDNIEIPHRIFDIYNKEHPDLGRKGLTTDVLEVYKKAAQDLMKEDARVYKDLLENGTITQEQYNSLLLGKVTIGLGYNDIADAIKEDKTIHVETDSVQVKGTERLPHPYTDANTQYTIAERKNIQKSHHENLYVHQDDVPVFDGTNMPNTLLLTMQRMEQATGKTNLQYLRERKDEEELPTSQRIINSIAREYGLDPKDTRVMATARVALIYSKDENNKVKIGNVLSAPLKPGLTEEQKQKAETHIMNQVKKSLKQIGIQDSEVDISSLTEEQQQMLQSVVKEIKEENAKRGER